MWTRSILGQVDLSCVDETWNAQRISEVANDPSIHPWVCGSTEEPLSFVEAVKDRNNVFLFGDHGGFCFRNMDGQVFDAHSMVLPSGRGEWALNAAEEALDWVFIRTQAQEVTMSVPKGNLAVRALVKRLNALFLGTIEDGWHFRGKTVPVDVYSVMKVDWICR